MRELILTRAISGAGKSYLTAILAAEVPETVICSADAYFVRAGKYDFMASRLGDAHKECQEKAKQAMANGVQRVIIDNTNTTRKEMLPYAKMAKEFGYTLKFATPQTAWAWDADELVKRNQHGVPLESIKRMLARFDHDITAESLMESLGYVPDCFELNDWCLKNEPEVYQSGKYLSPSAQYDLHLKIWNQRGCPEI